MAGCNLNKIQRNSETRYSSLLQLVLRLWLIFVLSHPLCIPDFTQLCTDTSVDLAYFPKERWTRSSQENIWAVLTEIAHSSLSIKEQIAPQQIPWVPDLPASHRAAGTLPCHANMMSLCLYTITVNPSWPHLGSSLYPVSVQCVGIETHP